MFRSVTTLLGTGCICAWVALSASAQSAQTASGWTAEIFPADAPGEFSAPGTSYLVRFPADLPSDAFPRLFLELDGFDVSSLIAWEGELAKLTPPQLLAAGDHTLRVVELLPDGTMVPRGSYAFQVRHSESLRELGASTSGSLQVSRRISERENDGQPPRTQGQGGAQISSRVQGDSWYATADGSLLYDSMHDKIEDTSEPAASGEASSLATPSSPSERELDLADFLVALGRGPVEGRFGHHEVGGESLVTSGFHRRGVSATLKGPDERTGVTAFAMRTAPVAGFRSGLDMGDSDERTVGVTAHSGFEILGSSWLLSSTYLRGAGPEAGTGVAGTPDESKGNALGFVLDGRMFDQQLGFRAEWAATRHDADGDRGPIDRERDSAYSVAVRYDPAAITLRSGNPFQWGVLLQHRRIGTWYRSLGNPGLLSDLEMSEASTTFQWTEANLISSFAQSRDNVNDIEEIGRVRTRRATVTTGWYPSSGWLGASSWLGQPFYSAMVDWVWRHQERMPAASTAYPVEDRTFSVDLQANFGHDTWNWGGGVFLSDLDDSVTPEYDSRTAAFSLNASAALGSRLNVSPIAQWSTIHYPELRLKERDRNLGATVLVVLWPERVTGTVTYNLFRHQSPYEDSDTRSASVGLNWNLLAATPRHPGAELWLRGTHQEREDDLAGTGREKDDQAFVGVTLSWAAAR